jgi:hypothetical protein
MKRMKDFLDFLGSLVKAWPALVVIAGLLVSVALAPTQIASTVVSLSIPLPLFIAIAALALYPIAKLVQRLFEHRKQEPFSYSGLLWKPALLGFRYPRPVCPRQDYGCEVSSRSLTPQQEPRISGPFMTIETQYAYAYECPIHGQLSVSNEPIEELQRKARQVQQQQQRRR